MQSKRIDFFFVTLCLKFWFQIGGAMTIYQSFEGLFGYILGFWESLRIFSFWGSDSGILPPASRQGFPFLLSRNLCCLRRFGQILPIRGVKLHLFGGRFCKIVGNFWRIIYKWLMILNNNILSDDSAWQEISEYLCNHFYHGLCLKGKPWSCGHTFRMWLTSQEQTRTDMSAEAATGVE